MAGGYKNYKENKNTMAVTQGSPAHIDLPLRDGQIDFVRYDVKVNGASPNKADTIASFPTLQLIVDGESWCKYRMEDLIKYNAFYGDDFEDGFIEQFYKQDWRTLVTEREATSMNPLLLNKPYMRLEVADGVVNPSADQHVMTEGFTSAQEALYTSDPENSNRSLIYFAATNVNVSGSGDVPSDYTYNLGGHAIRSFNFEGSNITRIKMYIDEKEEQDFKSLRHLNRDLSRAGFFPQADTWHLNFEIMAGSIAGTLDPNYGGKKRDIRFEIFTSTDDDVRLFVEQYNKPRISS